MTSADTYFFPPRGGGGVFQYIDPCLSEIWKLPHLPAKGCGHCLIGVDSEDPDHACIGPLPRVEIEALIE
jgi:hypothetical protein